MFESVRVKLTLFYLAILLVFSLLLTSGLRAFVQAEFNHANDVQRGAVHSLGVQFFGSAPPRESDRDFARIQTTQKQETQAHLNRETIVLNIAVLIIGGVLSYWYAGRALQPIEAAHEKQKRFTADASHELRTPLASMRLENELFLRQKSFDATEARKQVSSNLEEVARLERLTTSLLDLNNYESITLKPQKLDARALAAEAIKRAGHTEVAQQITFRNKTVKTMVLGDRESLLQLLGIFLDNAVKYGPKDGEVVVFGTEQSNDYVLAVRDQGGGIIETDLPHIFERMYRGDKARSNTVAGHGIGLSLAQEIAKANDVQLAAANHQAGGAQFSVTLPKA